MLKTLIDEAEQLMMRSPEDAEASPRQTWSWKSSKQPGNEMAQFDMHLGQATRENTTRSLTAEENEVLREFRAEDGVLDEKIGMVVLVVGRLRDVAAKISSASEL